MSGRLVHELEYHYSDGNFRDGSHVNITIRYYGKKDRFAIYKLANISKFIVFGLGQELCHELLPRAVLRSSIEKG